jgi:RHS repeat-associated protein
MHPVTFTYDLAGNETGMCDGLGCTTHAYDALGRQTVVTDTLGDVTRYGYDLLGRTTVITDPLGEVTRRGYDANGNLITVTNALSAATVYGYDGLDRCAWERDALGFTTTYEYDLVGNRTAVTDAAGRVTRYEYDGLGRALSVTDALSGTTRYGYDEVGNLTVITNANGHATSYAYNFLDQVTRKTNPLGKSWWYAYDDAGHLIREVDAEWQATYYEYDGAGRRTAIIYGSTGQRVDFEYDAVGNRTIMTDTTGVTTYVYDALDRPITVTSPLTGVVGYRYDARGNRTQVIYPDPSTGSGQGGKVVTYTYDAADRLASVVDWAGQTTTYGYDTAGRLVTETLPNGVQTISTYDDADRKIRLTHRRLEDGEMLGDYQFALDEVGNRVAVTETLVVPTDTLPITTVIHYTYDALGRLTAAGYSTGESFAYAYDSVGNRITYTRTITDTLVTTYTYDAANRLTSVNGQTYTWDNNGNLLNDGNKTYTYDRAGRMVRTESVSTTLVYTYNADGLRVAQSVDGEVTTFAWDWASAVPEMLRGGETLYLVGHETLGRWDGTAWAYHLPDALGSVRQATDAAGAVTAARQWTPYGVEMGSAQPGLGYTGEWWDESVGLLYLRARWYTPYLNRFTSPDTVVPDYQNPPSIHRYLYAFANPVSFRDPSGRYSCRFCTHNDEYNVIILRGWAGCKQLPDFVINLLGSDSSKPVSYALWRTIQQYDSVLTVEYYGGANLHGGRRLGGDPLVQIPSFGVPSAAGFSGGIASLAANDLAYLSMLAHEFWHATMQVPGSQGTAFGEADAYAMQSVILEEWDGNPVQITAIRQVAIDYIVSHPLGFMWGGTCLTVNQAFSMSIFDRFRGLRWLYNHGLLTLDMLYGDSDQ